MSITAAKLWVEVGAKTEEAARGLNAFSGKLQDIGKGLSAAVTLPVVGGFKLMSDAVAEAQAVMAQTDAVIRSTGGAAGLTADQIARMATELSRASTFEDEAVQKGENLLLTFTNIGQDVFPEATQALVDMATAMGTDVSSQAIQLGKALNDPTAGLSALTRVGVTFTAEQEKMIKAMQASGDVAGAQKVILAELNKEFGGSALAAMSTYGGQLAQLQNEFGNLAEMLGGTMMPIAQEWIAAAKEAVLTVQGWTPEQQKLAVELAAVAAAAGPAAFAVGSLGKALSSGLSAAVSFGGAVAKLPAFMGDVNNAFQMAQAGSGAFGVASSGAATLVATLAPLAVAIAAAAAAWIAYEEVQRRNTEGQQAAADAMQDLLSRQATAEGVAEEYAAAVERMNDAYADANPLVTLFIDKNKLLGAQMPALSGALANTTRNYADYKAKMDAAARAQGMFIDENGNLARSFEVSGAAGTQMMTEIVQAQAAMTEAQYLNNEAMRMANAIGDDRAENIAAYRDALAGVPGAIGPVITAEEALKQIQEANNARLQEFSTIMGGAVENELADYYQKQKDAGAAIAETTGKIDILNAKKYLTPAQKEELAELNQQLKDQQAVYAENAAEHEKATARIIFGFLQQQVAADGLTADEMTFLAEVGEAWGIYPEKTAAALKLTTDAFQKHSTDAQGFLKALSDSALALPNVDRYITYHASVTGQIPDAGVNDGEAPVIIAPGDDTIVDGMRAAGGPVWPSGSFVVGENGPEIFSPSMAGMITPLTGGGSATWTGDIIINGATDAQATAALVLRKLEDRGIVSKIALR